MEPRPELSLSILHVISGLDSGGAERMLLRLVVSMPRHVHQVVSLSGPGALSADFSARGIAVHSLGMRSVGSFPIAFCRLVSLMKRVRPDIVQTWMVHADLLGGLAAKYMGLPLAWGVRTTDYSIEAPRTRAIRWLCARLSRVVPDRVVCAASASLKASEQAGYEAGKLMVIPNGFDAVALRKSLGSGDSVRKSAGILPGSLVVGCMGRYDPAKDHANFVRAAALVKQSYPACRFLMVGRGLDSSNDELISLISAADLSESFILLGERQDPAACLDAMDVFVLSSRTEGFPNVLGEAMTMGVPCVSTDVGDAALLLGAEGEIVPALDSEALSAAILRTLAMSPECRVAQGRRLMERVERMFSIESVARLYADLYEELSGHPKIESPDRRR